MDLETAKKLITSKVVINGRINRHYAREDWRAKNGISNLFDWLNAVYGGPIKYQIKVVLDHDGIVPDRCETCKEWINFQESMSVLCDTCKKEEANRKRRLTNLDKYGHVSANGNFDVQQKSKQTRLERYGSEVWNNQEKAKETCLSKYGVEHPMKLPEIQKKVLQTQIDVYGDVLTKTDFFKDKSKISMMERYGVDHPMQSTEVKNRLKNTNIEKYSVENVFQSEEVKQKISTTKIERYGNKNYNNREQSLLTCMSRYGVENVSQSDDIRAKIEESNLMRYGVRYPIQLEEKQIARIETFKKNKRSSLIESFSESQLAALRNISELYDEHVSQGKSIAYFADKYGVSKSFLRTYFIECGFDIKSNAAFSLEQQMFSDRLKDFFGFEIVDNDRAVLRPKEIDIWLPEYNLGIEYHGSYWHSIDDDVVDQKHYTKYKLAEEKGIRLIQVFDREVEQKFEHILSIIAVSIKHHTVTRIHARKCEIKEISNVQYRDFCEKNHIQGHAVASVKLGAFYNDELISIMSFSKSRFSDKYEYEMTRFCNKLFTVIPGMMSRLFNFFVVCYKPVSIVSYADCRFFTGQSYRNLGFSFLNHSSPNYWYISSTSDKLENRIKFQKHKLEGLLGIYDPLLSEKKNMLNNGYRIAYDAGNNVYVWAA
jgi:hypothetical protein